MDEKERIEETTPTTEENSGYVPRPMWQVWGARVALVLFIALVIMYTLNIMRGG